MKRLIVLVSAVGIAAVAGAIVVGTRDFDGTVVDRPYERGLDWERERERRRESGLEVRLAGARFAVGPSRVVFTIAGAASGGLADRDVAVRVRRPETAEHQRETRARRLPDGTWGADIALPVAGRWELTVLVEQAGGRIEFPTAVVAAAGGGGVADAAAGCDLNRGPCSAALPGGAGTLTLEISPRPVRAMQELEFSVRLACAQGPCAPRSAAIALTMPGMYMGENTVALAPAAEAGTLRGRGTLVRCPSGRRLWRATVKVPPLGESSFDFETARP